MPKTPPTPEEAWRQAMLDVERTGLAFQAALRRARELSAGASPFDMPLVGIAERMLPTQYQPDVAFTLWQRRMQELGILVEPPGEKRARERREIEARETAERARVADEKRMAALRAAMIEDGRLVITTVPAGAVT